MSGDDITISLNGIGYMVESSLLGKVFFNKFEFNQNNGVVTFLFYHPAGAVRVTQDLGEILRKPITTSVFDIATGITAVLEGVIDRQQ